MRHFGFLLLILVSTQAQGFIANPYSEVRPQAWDYDPGPAYQPDLGLVDLNAKALIDLSAAIPNFPALSEALMGYQRGRPTQKFRPPFGPSPWRMILKPNSVKILFIGQDATHIAEAAGRPGTAGFGGRAQDLAAFFGVEYGAAFINAYAYTIKGQYGARGAPWVRGDQVQAGQTIVPNDVWLMSQHQDSPLVQWRNDLLTWIINNNRDSLKLIVAFGGAAKDSIATFIEANGGEVGSRFEDSMDEINVPLFKLVPSGGNGEFPVALNAQGKDAYASLLGRKLDYKKPKDQRAALSHIKKNDEEAMEEMVFTHAGPYGNGLWDAAQLGGFDLDKISIAGGKSTRSLKGLKLKRGGKIKTDILVTTLPHPTFLSHRLNDAAIAHWKKVLEGDEHYEEMKAEAGRVPEHRMRDFLTKVLKSHPDKAWGRKMISQGFDEGRKQVGLLVEKDVRKLRDYAEAGWRIVPDASDDTKVNVNSFDEGKMYEYGRSDIHNVYYDFGTPKNRMVSKSTARRGRHGRRGSQIIVLGSRDMPKYDKPAMDAMLEADSYWEMDPDQLFTSRARTEETRYVFDPGPGPRFAQMMKDMDLGKIFKPKKGKSFGKHGTEAFITQSHPMVGDFGHYRGTFVNPEVVILADPDGYDDLITARALTGTRGQYLQGLMDDLGVGDQYLLLKTVPFGMDGASKSDWEKVLELTRESRQQVLFELLTSTTPRVVISDGTHAARELELVLEQLDGAPPMYKIHRDGLANGSGILSAGRVLAKEAFLGTKVTGEMHDIPRSHLTFYARMWEGTSGDRVLNSTGSQAGLAFLEVVPNWVMDQEVTLNPESRGAVKKLLRRAEEYGFPLPSQSIPEFLETQQEASGF